MALTAVAVCNQALALLGQKAITDLGGGDVHSRLCAAVYETVRDELLAVREWAFATAWHTLSPLSTPPGNPRFATQYRRPAGVLRVLQRRSVAGLAGTAVGGRRTCISDDAVPGGLDRLAFLGVTGNALRVGILLGHLGFLGLHQRRRQNHRRQHGAQRAGDSKSPWRPHILVGSPCVGAVTRALVRGCNVEAMVAGQSAESNRPRVNLWNRAITVDARIWDFVGVRVPQ